MVRRCFASIAVILAVTVSWACSDSGPGSLSVAGSWSGVTVFNSGFTTSMDLTQTGSEVSGTMRIAGAFLDNPITGTVSAEDRTLEWEVADGCESWGGTLTISADGQGMTGPVLADVSGCPSGSNSSGTVTVTRQ
jgi:hypothetical protein